MAGYWDRASVGQLLRRAGSRTDLAEWNLRDRIRFLTDSVSRESILFEVECRRCIELARWDGAILIHAFLVVLLGLFFVRALAFGSPTSQWAFGGLLAVTFAHGCTLVHRRQRTEEALLDGQCPDCKYQLCESVEGLGPERCPECGGLWPLVPPDRGDGPD